MATKALPQSAAPVKGIVPVGDDLALGEITFRRKDDELGWIYTVHQRRPDKTLVIHHAVTQAQLVQAIMLSYKFALLQQVHIGTYTTMKVQRRQWNFEKGEGTYWIGPPFADRNLVRMGETELERRIKANEDGQGTGELISTAS